MKNLFAYPIVGFFLCIMAACQRDNAAPQPATAATTTAAAAKPTISVKQNPMQPTITTKSAAVHNGMTPSISANTTLPAKKQTAIDTNAKVKWTPITQLSEVGAKEKKKVMIDLYTDWCGWCKRMDKNTFEQEDISKKLNNKFIPVKFDAEMQEIVNFKGKQYGFQGQGRRGFNTLAYELAKGKLSYPTIVFLDEQLNVIQAFPGYQDPQQFETILAYIEGNHYKNQQFAEFQKSYIPKIPKS